jgi:hypothetical protein
VSETKWDQLVDELGTPTNAAAIVTALKTMVDSASPDVRRHCPNFDQFFAAPFARIISVDFNEHDAAFRLDDDTLHLNLMPIRRILQRAVGEASANPKDGMTVGQVRGVAIRAVWLHLLHEMRHVSQNILSLAEVDRIKRIGGPKLMSEMDLYADRDAANALAALMTAGKEVRDYLSAFLEALFLLGTCCYPAFNFPIESPWKIARALSVLIMAARLDRALNGESRDEALFGPTPLDGPLVVHINDKLDSLLIVTPHPGNGMAGLQPIMSPRVVRGLATELSRGEFAALIAPCKEMLAAFEESITRATQEPAESGEPLRRG